MGGALFSESCRNVARTLGESQRGRAIVVHPSPPFRQDHKPVIGFIAVGRRLTWGKVPMRPTKVSDKKLVVEITRVTSWIGRHVFKVAL